MSGTGASTPDAIVVGAGPNGLVAANLLADAGWDVLVLEAQPEPGGAVRSTRDVHDGYVHDTFSSFYPLAAVSPTIKGLHLEDHGLIWSRPPAPVGTPFADGEWALLYPERHQTADAFQRAYPGDGPAWLRLCHTWDRIGPSVVGALLSPFPPVRHAAGAAARVPTVGGLAFIRRMLSPCRRIVEEEFGGRAPRVLIAGNAAHADIPMEAPGSGLMGLLLVMLGQQVGYPVPKGGAGALTDALVRRLTAAGVEIRTGCRVDRVVLERGRAVGVRLQDGEVITARRGVLADVSAPALYGGLVPWQDLPERVQTAMQRFEWDPATVKVDWALDAPVPWATPPDAAPGTVHLVESVDELDLWQAQIRAGQVPRHPYLVMGQMATADPTRAPAGCESLWAYTHVPQHISDDSGFSDRWDEDEKERYADLMQARIEQFAPSFARHILTRRVLSPLDLQARDENLFRGAVNGGTSNLQQQAVFRPIPGLGRAETPVRGLYLASAAAHPGGGVHGACGSNAARAALAHERFRRR